MSKTHNKHIKNRPQKAWAGLAFARIFPLSKALGKNKHITKGVSPMSNRVLIFKGMEVGVLPGDLTISVNEDGEKTSKLILSTAYNVIPLWLRAAHDHLKKSKIASEKIFENWSEDPDEQKALLVSELTPSIQVFVSCGIALDALYDTLRPHAKDYYRRNPSMER